MKRHCRTIVLSHVSTTGKFDKDVTCRYLPCVGKGALVQIMATCPSPTKVSTCDKLSGITSVCLITKTWRVASTNVCQIREKYHFKKLNV